MPQITRQILSLFFKTGARCNAHIATRKYTHRQTESCCVSTANDNFRPTERQLKLSQFQLNTVH